MKILVLMLLSMLLMGCFFADFSKDRLAAHREFCASYKHTRYDCTRPDPDKKIYVPAFGSYIEQGRIQ